MIHLKNILLFIETLFGFRHLSFNAVHFIIEDLKQNPLGEFLTAERGPFFKIFHLTSGKGLLVAGVNKYQLKAGDIAFAQPGELISWRSLSSNLEGHFCFVHPKFFKRADHVLHLFNSFPHIHSKNVIPLNEVQSGKVQQHFELIHKEVAGHFENKKQAILLHLQMILIKVKRAGRIEK